MKEIDSMPESGMSNRNWNDPMPILVLLPVELLFYGGYVIVFGVTPYRSVYCLPALM